MNRKLLLAIPLVMGMSLAGINSAYAQECDDEDSLDKALAECKPLTRAEVKVEAKKAGAKVAEMGDCPNYPVAKSAAGKTRTRAEVKREAAEAARTDTAMDMGECPK